MKPSGLDIFFVIAISGSLGLALWVTLLRRLSKPQPTEQTQRWWLEESPPTRLIQSKADLLWQKLVRANAKQKAKKTDPSRVQHANKIVILIHGTTFGFCLKHRWMSSESNLCETLRETFKPEEIAIAKFFWSGRNRFLHREAAANNLKQYINALKAANREANIYLIAHSHGGSVATQALQDESIAASVAGLISLSTPYLHSGRVREKASRDTGILVRVGGMVVAPFLIYSLITIWQTKGPIFPALNNSFKWFSEPNIICLLFCGALAIVAGILAWSAYARIKSHASSLIHTSCRPPKISNNRLLILRTQGDEASFAIGTIGFMNWLAGKLFNILVRPIDAIGTSCSQFTNAPSQKVGAFKIFAAAALLIASFATTSFLSLLYFDSTTNSWHLQSVIHLMLTVTFSYLILMIAAAEVLVATALLLTIVQKIASGLSVGWELMIAGSDTVVSVEATPPGTWRITYLDFAGNTSNAIPLRGALLHSILYESKEAITLISDWIKKNP